MIPSAFFASLKYTESEKDRELTLDDERALNSIFYELYAAFHERAEKDEYLPVTSTGLAHAVPSDFFNPYQSMRKHVHRIKKEEIPAAKDDSVTATKGKKKNTQLSYDEVDMGRMIDFVKNGLSPRLKREFYRQLKDKLNAAGFKVDNAGSLSPSFEFYIAEALENFTSRPASLNCYDFIRLKDEVGRLKVLAGDVERKCATLLSLIKEVDDAEKAGEEYPVRWFPFTNVRCRSPWAYQCLRMMDEILYTTPSPIPSIPTSHSDLSTMQDKIKEACEKYGITYESVTEDSLKKNFVALRNLINVEFNGDFRRSYANEGVYVYSRSHGHMYAQMKNSPQRVTAFKLCFSLYEARTIQRELNLIIEDLKEMGVLSSLESFGEEFPLLCALASIDRYNPDTLSGRARLNSLTGKKSSSLYTLNYLPSTDSTTKKKVEKALDTIPPMAINILSGNKQGTYLPINLNEQGLSWSLLAKDVKNDTLHNIQPNEFGDDFTLTPCEFDALEQTSGEKIIGLGDFHFDRKLCKVSLHLTVTGYKKLQEPSEPLYPLVEGMEKDKYVSSYSNYKGVASMSVYINDDFFEELFRLDRNKHIEDIQPTEIKAGYLDFLRRKNRKSYQQSQIRKYTPDRE